MKHPSLDGLKPYHEYIEHLQEIYPNVPYDTIKKVEKKYKDEREMNNELKRLNQAIMKEYVVDIDITMK